MAKLPAISLNSSNEVKISLNPSLPLKNSLSLTIENLESGMTYYLAYPVGDKEIDLVTDYEQVSFFITDEEDDEEDESENLRILESKELECLGLDSCVSKTAGYLVKSDGKDINCTLENIVAVKEKVTNLYLFSVDEQNKYTRLCEEKVKKKKVKTKLSVDKKDKKYISVPYNLEYSQADTLSFMIENLELGVQYYLAYLVGSKETDLVTKLKAKKVSCKISLGSSTNDELEKKDHEYDFNGSKHPTSRSSPIYKTKGWFIKKVKAVGNDIKGTLENIHTEQEGTTWLYLFSVKDQNYECLGRIPLVKKLRKLNTTVRVTGGIPIEVSQKGADEKRNTLLFTIEDLEIGVKYYLAYPVGDKATDLVTETEAIAVSYEITSGEATDCVEKKEHKHTFTQTEDSGLPLDVSKTRGLTLQKKSKEGASSISGSFDNICTQREGLTALYLFSIYAKNKYRKLKRDSFGKELLSLEITDTKADPAVIESGETTDIFWTCKGAVRSYRLLPFDEDKDAATKIVYKRRVKLVDSTDIYVEVNNFVRKAREKPNKELNQLSVQKEVHISVKKSEIKEFKLSCDGKDVPEGQAIKPGKTVVLSWDVTNLGTRTISISPSLEIDTPLEAKGSVVLEPKDAITYTLKVSNEGRKGKVVAEEKIKIDIDELKIIDFFAEPKKVNEGRSDIKFSWKLKNAEVATISPTYMTRFDDLGSIRIKKEYAIITVNLDSYYMINKNGLSYTLTAARTNSEGIWETTEKHLKLAIKK